jgi:hypothetical protein
MKKNVLLITCIIALCIHFSSCNKDGRQDYITTVSVLDMDQKPVKGRVVKLTGGFGKKDSATTNSNGEVVLKYFITWGQDFNDHAEIHVQDDSLFQSLEYVFHDGGNETPKQFFTIHMDSLIRHKIRLQKTDTVTSGISIGINDNTRPSGYKSTPTTKYFLNWAQTTKIKNFDSTFVFLAWKKAPVDISANSVKSFKSKMSLLNFRDSSFLIRL